METQSRHEQTLDESMRKRVRNAGIVGVGALAAIGVVGAGQVSSAEREPAQYKSSSVSAEEMHISRAEAQNNTTEGLKDVQSTPEKETQQNKEPAAWWPVDVKQNWLSIQQVASEYMLDPYLVATIVAEESMGQNITNQSGAQGLMQIMPSTAQEIARLRHRAYYNMADNSQNLDYGCWLIHYLNEKYIKTRGVDLNSDMGIAMLAVYYGDGEGAGEVWARNGYKQALLSEQAGHVAPLWTSMYRDRHSSKSEIFASKRMSPK